MKTSLLYLILKVAMRQTVCSALVFAASTWGEKKKINSLICLQHNIITGLRDLVRRSLAHIGHSPLD